jgi:hypothetical protein
MKERNAKFELRTPLFLWNALLTAFSFWGVCRSLPELIHTTNHHGFMYSVCDPTYKRGITGLWFVVLFFSFPLSSWAFLIVQGLAIHGFESARDRRYVIYRSQTTTAHLPSLVSPCIRARLLFLQVIDDTSLFSHPSTIFD